MLRQLQLQNKSGELACSKTPTSFQSSCTADCSSSKRVRGSLCVIWTHKRTEARVQLLSRASERACGRAMTTSSRKQGRRKNPTKARKTTAPNRAVTPRSRTAQAETTHQPNRAVALLAAYSLSRASEPPMGTGSDTARSISFRRIPSPRFPNLPLPKARTVVTVTDSEPRDSPNERRGAVM